MRSKVNVLGHPVHPTLVGFPIACYGVSLIAFVASAFAGGSLFFRGGVITSIAGVATAAIAAIPGLIDWASLPREHPAKRVGLKHMGLNVGALVVFGVNALVQAPHWDDPTPSPFLAIAMSALGVGLTLAAGLMGWRLLSRYHVGVDLAAKHAHPYPSDGDLSQKNRPSFHGV